ncbi:HSP90 family protein [Herbiconiux sp. CPCC 205763]|uniref:HSP90 family protein n=1 Tax=Herbiconiux aconitum TaxID=2970913 RepID=A0ABT2GSB0_9MICO|nr:HSP90 family protein [Herbiconiux aconitum]MCS5718185.1 HSP90 family protein [Herbiconiux aconitum]
MIDLLSRHIYSSPHVFLRELLQNARDAMVARGEWDSREGLQPSVSGRGVLVLPCRPGQSEFAVIDDGIGLTIDEVEELLATVGSSSKRDMFELPHRDYLGQFGIGLLSCFMVSDRISVTTRSAKGGSAVQWVGSTDGTFTVRRLSTAESARRRIGTEVRLIPSADPSMSLDSETVTALVRRYARFLDVPILVEDAQGRHVEVNQHPVFIDEITAGNREAIEAFGRGFIGATPFDMVSLRAPSTSTRGVAFILPFAQPPGSRRSGAVHLGGMLVSERSEELTPNWLVFARVCVDSDGLTPTASREQLVENDALLETRNAIGAAVREWILELAAERPRRFAEFVSIHEMSLKGVALHDDEFARCLLPHLAFETSSGRMELGDLLGGVIRYAHTVDEFRQVAPLMPLGRPILNAGHAYDVEILERAPALFAGTTLETVTAKSESERFGTPPASDRQRVLRLVERAGAVLSDSQVAVIVRLFEPSEVAALSVHDAGAVRRAELEGARSVSDDLWKDVLDRVDAIALDIAGPPLRSGLQLCLNWNNQIVRSLAEMSDRAAFEEAVRLLNLQAVLASHRPLRPVDRAMVARSFTAILQRTIAPGTGRPR